MNPGEKKNPLSSDKSWQFPKENALGMYLMKKKMKEAWGCLSYLLLKTWTLLSLIKPNENTDKSPAHSTSSHRHFGKRER